MVSAKPMEYLKWRVETKQKNRGTISSNIVKDVAYIYYLFNASVIQSWAIAKNDQFYEDASSSIGLLSHS